MYTVLHTLAYMQTIASTHSTNTHMYSTHMELVFNPGPLSSFVYKYSVLCRQYIVFINGANINKNKGRLN